MSKKQLDTTEIVSELRQGSVFFQKPEDRSDIRTEERTDIRTEQRPENRTENRTVTLPIKRRTKRYSFEFYEDQIDELKKIKIEAELDAKSITMSEIVREALDQYLATVRKSERTEERTEIRAEFRPENRSG
ncbi:hypothetical protein KQH40_00315 [bacterium]|nr:hypothetical protein [bacterium]